VEANDRLSATAIAGEGQEKGRERSDGNRIEKNKGTIRRKRKRSPKP
jgi:hypothetical protein